MTTTTSTFTPSTHTLEVDRMNFTPADLIPDSLRLSTYVIEAGEHLQDNGWNGLGADVETAGHIMRVFGFDEAEEEILDPGFAPGLEIPIEFVDYPSFWQILGGQPVSLPILLPAVAHL